MVPLPGEQSLQANVRDLSPSPWPHVPYALAKPMTCCSQTLVCFQDAWDVPSAHNDFSLSFQPSELLLIPQSQAHTAPPFPGGQNLLFHATQPRGCRHELMRRIGTQ